MEHFVFISVDDKLLPVMIFLLMFLLLTLFEKILFPKKTEFIQQYLIWLLFHLIK